MFLAFSISPIAATAAIAIVVYLMGETPPLPGFLFAVGIVAYLTAIVLGVPTFLMTRSWLRSSPFGYAVIGAVIGLAPAAWRAI